MGTNLRRLFEDNDTKFFIAGFVGQLFEPDGCAQSSWACWVARGQSWLANGHAGGLPPPTMHTSTSSDSRSCSWKSNDSSTVAYCLGLDVEKARMDTVVRCCCSGLTRLRGVSNSSGEMPTAEFSTGIWLLHRYCRLTTDLATLFEAISSGPTVYHSTSHDKQMRPLKSQSQHALEAMRNQSFGTSRFLMAAATCISQ